MTDAEILTLLEQEREATPAPWEWWADDHSMLTLWGPGDAQVLASNRCKACQSEDEYDRFRCGWPLKKDSDLIVALRNKARALLEELLELRILAGRNR